MRMLLAPIVAVLAGLALVSACRQPLSRLQHLGAAMALGPAALGALLTLATLCGVDFTATVWVLTISVPVLCVILHRRGVTVSETGTAPALVGAGVLALCLTVRLLAVPAAQGDGLSISLLRALSMQMPEGPWAWLASPESSMLHGDYPLGIPALMACGQVLSGDQSDLAALLPLLLPLPGIALFCIATLSRSHRGAAWLAAAGFALFPLLRTYATSGHADPLLAAVLACALIAEGRLAWSALLLMPFLKLEGSVLTLLGCACSAMQPRQRLGWGLACAIAVLIWPAALLMHDVHTGWREVVASAAGFPEILSAWVRSSVAPEAAGAALPLLGVLSALVMRQDAWWRRRAVVISALVLLMPLLLWLRGTSAAVAVHGDVFDRLTLQLAPALITLAAAATVRLFRASAQTHCVV